MLPDTDRVPLSLHALELHSLLPAHGFEVRTVALAPGAAGGLDSVLPVLGPSRGSPAAAIQLGREQRWADVVVSFGAGAAAVQQRSPGHRRVASVAVCTEVPPGRRRRALERCDVVLYDGCDAPVPGAREVFTGTRGEGSAALGAAEVAGQWVAALDAALSRRRD